MGAYWPAAHLPETLERPEASQKNPDGHAEQLIAPSPLAKKPTEQKEQAVAEEDEYRPAGHAAVIAERPVVEQ